MILFEMFAPIAPLFIIIVIAAGANLIYRAIKDRRNGKQN